MGYPSAHNHPSYTKIMKRALCIWRKDISKMVEPNIFHWITSHIPKNLRKINKLNWGMFDHETMLQTSLWNHYLLRHLENIYTTLECVINKTCNNRLLEGELLSCTLFTLLWFFQLSFPKKVFNESTKDEI